MRRRTCQRIGQRSDGVGRHAGGELDEEHERTDHQHQAQQAALVLDARKLCDDCRAANCAQCALEWAYGFGEEPGDWSCIMPPCIPIRSLRIPIMPIMGQLWVPIVL